MWFLIGNKHRRFSIAKFALITGLRYIGVLDKNMLKTGDDSFKEYYFKDYGKLSKTDLETVFLMSQFRSDKEATNMVVLYFIINFLLFKDKSWLMILTYKYVPMGLLMSTLGVERCLI